MKRTQNIFSKPISKTRTTFTQARRDESGVAAIEFAIIAPILLWMYFGVAEMATTISIDRRISQGASVAGDIATQDDNLSLANAEELLSAAMRVMNAPDPAKIYIDIESLKKRPSDGVVRTVARIQLNKDTNKAMDSYQEAAAALDPQILNNSSGIVVARVKYLYSPLKLRHLNSDILLTETFLLKPRKTATLALNVTSTTRIICTATKASNVSCAEFEPPSS